MRITRAVVSHIRGRITARAAAGIGTVAVIAATSVSMMLTRERTTIMPQGIAAQASAAPLARLVIDHPAVRFGVNGWDEYSRPRYAFVAIRVSQVQLPAGRCMMVDRRASLSAGSCWNREEWGRGDDVIVVPVRVDDQNIAYFAARVDGIGRVVPRTAITELPLMRMAELPPMKMAGAQ